MAHRGKTVVDDETAKILNDIGQLLAEDVEYPLDNTLLYARLDRNMVAPSIYKNLGNHILYRAPDLDRLGDALLDLWEAQTQKPRWAEIEYLIKDGRFTADFAYPSEIDPKEDNFVRRDRIVVKYFGEKPVMYPQFDGTVKVVPPYVP